MNLFYQLKKHETPKPGYYIRITNQITCFPLMNKQHKSIVFETGHKMSNVFNQNCYQINRKTPTSLHFRLTAE